MEFSEVCPLYKVGVTSDLLLRVADDSDTEAESTFKVARVTNEMVLELHHFMNRNASCTYYTLWRWLALLFGDDWPKSDFPAVKAVRQSVLCLSSKQSMLKKMP